MDVNKLVDVSNNVYIMVVHELRNNNIPVAVGRLVIESVYRRFTEDALAAAVAYNGNLESELAKKMNEIEELKSKVNDSIGDKNGGNDTV